MARFAIASALFGGRDAIPPPPPETVGHSRAVLFVDESVGVLQAPGWDVVPSPALEGPQAAARRCKALLLDLLPGEDCVVWADARIRFTGEPLEGLVEVARRTGCGAYLHPERFTIEQEAAACAELGRSDADSLSRQIAAYQGERRQDGLFATGLLIRHRTPAVELLGREWWREQRAHTLRDQVSFPVVLARAGVQCVPLPGRMPPPGGRATPGAHITLGFHLRGAGEDRGLIRGAPALITAMAYAHDRNLGAAYNAIVDRLRGSDWVCFLDHDAIWTTPDWHRQITEAATSLGGQVALLTAVTNRIGNPRQRAPGAPQGHDMAAHRAFGAALASQHGATLEDVTDGPPISGVVLACAARTWRLIGGAGDGFLGVDNGLFHAVRRKGGRIYQMPGVYVQHWYRADENAEAARLIRKGWGR